MCAVSHTQASSSHRPHRRPYRWLDPAIWPAPVRRCLPRSLPTAAIPRSHWGPTPQRGLVRRRVSKCVGNPTTRQGRGGDDDHKGQATSVGIVQAPAEYDEFLSSGVVNGRQHGWVFLSIPPGVAYPLHAHPGLEMVYIVSGRLHEIRLQDTLTYTPMVGEPGVGLATTHPMQGWRSRALNIEHCVHSKQAPM